MNEDEKATLAATLSAYEEILATLLSRVLAETPQDHLEQLQQRMAQGPMINPDAPPAPDIDTADRIAGWGMEYDEVVNRIYSRALAMSGR
jgi:hypothetical protein